MESLAFFVPGKPKGKGRPRHNPNGRPYTDNQTRAYEYQIAVNYRRVAGKFRFPDDVFLRVRVQQQMPVPKSASKTKKTAMLEGHIYPSAKPDLDNVIKSVLDALNGVAYKDDARVVGLYSQKIYSDNPGVLVEISRMGGDT
jgi:Holliday junction resolvase RusA-like endonuclease